MQIMSQKTPDGSTVGASTDLDEVNEYVKAGAHVIAHKGKVWLLSWKDADNVVSKARTVTITNGWHALRLLRLGFKGRAGPGGTYIFNDPELKVTNTLDLWRRQEAADEKRRTLFRER